MKRHEIAAAIEQRTPLLMSSDPAWAGLRPWDKPRRVRAVEYLGRRTRIEYLDGDRNDVTGEPGMLAGDLKVVDNAALRGAWAELSSRVDGARRAAEELALRRQHRDRVEEYAREVFERHGLAPTSSRKFGATVDPDALETVLSFYDLAHDPDYDRQD